MPNHCENVLSVAGPADQLRAFQECVRSTEDDVTTELSFARLLPVPPAMLDHDLAERLGERIGQVSGANLLPSWYSWCIVNWGTKWDAWDVSLNIDDFGLEYRFTTAWSPPLPWLSTVSAMFPDLLFAIRFLDEGFMVCGWAVFKNEECRCGDIKLELSDDEQNWPTIGDISIPHEAYSEVSS